MTFANLEALFRITDHYMHGALLQAKHAKEIEQKYALEMDLSDEDRFGHISYSIASITQSVGALEAELAYILKNGLGSIFGTNKIVGIQISNPSCWAKSIRDKNRDITIPKKFNEILNSMKLNQVDLESNPFKHVDLICKIRNELVHYNGLTNTTYESKAFVISIDHLRLSWPPWSNSSQFPFPHRYLGWAISIFSLESISNFIREVYEKNSLASPLNLVKIISELDRIKEMP